MNGLSNEDETYREQPLAPSDDLIRFWKSKVKVTAGCSEGNHVNTGTSKYIFQFCVVVSFGLLVHVCFCCVRFSCFTTIL